MITPDGCSMMNRAVENMELLKTMGKSKPKFFYEYMEIPMKADDNGLNPPGRFSSGSGVFSQA